MNTEDTFFNKIQRTREEAKLRADEFERTTHPLPRHALFNKSLIIDARMGSRKRLRQDLEVAGLFEHTFEASSLQQGLEALQNEQWDACIIGPSLSVESVEYVIQEGRKVVKSLDCAFIAVVKEKDVAFSAKFLGQAGVHCTMGTNYSRKSFTELVCNAIREAHAHPIIRENAESSLEDLLSDSASRLRAIAGQLAAGAVETELDGQINPQLSEMISAVFESMFPEKPDLQHDSKDDRQFFAYALTDWVSKRTRTSHKKATEYLRRKLIANLYRNNAVFAVKEKDGGTVVKVMAK